MHPAQCDVLWNKKLQGNSYSQWIFKIIEKNREYTKKKSNRKWNKGTYTESLEGFNYELICSDKAETAENFKSKP